MTNYNFFEFKELCQTLQHPFFSEDQSVQAIINFLNSLLKDKEKSASFQLIDPESVNTSVQHSQCRTINIDPKNKDKIKNSAARNGIICPIFCGEIDGTDFSYELYNGRHRLESLIEINASQNKVDLIPAVIIPKKLRKVLLGVLDETQAILNEKLSYATNNDNDVGKLLRKLCERDGLDLSKPSVYNNLLEKAKVLYKHKSEKTLKNNITRIRNAQARDASDVYCGTPKDFINNFKAAKTMAVPFPEKSGKDYDKFAEEVRNIENMNIRSVSMKGSTLDQEWTRGFVYKSENANEDLYWLYFDSSNKGDSKTVINSRKSFWEKIYRTYKAFEATHGSRTLPFDYVIISPQIQSGITFQFDGKEVSSSPEKLASYENWIKISKKDIIKVFDSKKSYSQDWIFKEIKRTHLKAV